MDSTLSNDSVYSSNQPIAPFVIGMDIHGNIGSVNYPAQLYFPQIAHRPTPNFISLFAPNSQIIIQKAIQEVSAKTPWVECKAILSDGHTSTSWELTYSSSLGAHTSEHCVCIGKITTSAIAKRSGFETYTSAFQNTPASFLVTRLEDGLILEVNEAWSKMFGFTREEAIGNTTVGLKIGTEEYRKKMVSIIRKEKNIKNIIAQFYKKDRGQVTMLVSSSLIEIDGLECILSTGYDITELQQKTDELKASQSLLSTLVDNLPGYVYRVANNSDYTPIFISTSVVDVTGYPQQEYLVDRTISCGKEIHPDDADWVWDVVQKALAKNEAYQCEYRIITKQGKQKWVWERGKGIRNEQGELIYLEGFVTDVSERKSLKLQIEQERNRLGYILEGTNIGTWEWNVQTGETIFNERWASIIGYTLEELSPVSIETWMKFAHPDDLGRSGELLNRHFSGELGYYECETRMKHKDGHWVWVLDRGKVTIWTDDGKPQWMYGTHQEISERKALEFELIKSKQEYQLLAENIDAIIWQFDLQTDKWLYVSPQAEKILGYSPNEWSNFQWWVDHMHPEDQTWAPSFCMRKIEEGSSHDFEYRFLHKNGSVVWIQDKVTVEREKGKPDYLYGVMFDITQKKKAQEEIRRSNLLLEESQTIAKLGGWELDLQTNELYWTAETYRIHQTSPEEFNPTVDAGVSYFLPESKEKIIKALELAMTKGIGYDLYLETYTTKGSHIHVRTTCVVTMRNGKPIKLTGIFQDITEQKRAEAQREYEHKEKESLINSTKDLIWSIDRDFCLLAANEAFIDAIRQYSGVRLVVGESVLRKDIFPPDLLAFWLEMYQKALNGETFVKEFTRATKNNSQEYWMELTVNPIWGDGKVAGIVCYGRDITKRKQAEQNLESKNKILIEKEVELLQHIAKLDVLKNELISQNQHIEAVLSALDSSAIVTTTDVKGRILKANGLFCKISQYSEQELIGQTHKLINSGHHPKEFWQTMWQTITAGKVWYGEVCNRAKDGTLYWVYTINNPIFDTEGKIEYFLSIRFDITQRKLAEQRLTHQNHLLSEIGFEQSHTLRRPLANILGLLDLIKMEKEKNDLESLFEYLGYLEQAANETDRVIHSIVEKANRAIE